MIRRQALRLIGVSQEVKKLLLDKLLDIADNPHVQEWDIGVGRFSGQWSQWLVGTMKDSHKNAARQVLQISNIQCLEFVSSSVLLWHVVTDICSLATADTEIVDGSAAHADNRSTHTDTEIGDAGLEAS